MNESVFFLHAGVILFFLFLSVKLGKEALFIFVSSCWLFANFFVTKQITLFGFDVTASDVYVVGGVLSTGVIQQYYGISAAKKSVQISFLLLIFATCTSYMHLQYTPSVYDTMHVYFQTILQATPRLMIASLITFYICQSFEIILFRILQKKTNWPLFVRAGFSSALSLALDTALFSFLGLYGLVASLLDVFLMSYAVKLIIIGMLAPFLTFVQYFFPKQSDTRNHEQVSI